MIVGGQSPLVQSGCNSIASPIGWKMPENAEPEGGSLAVSQIGGPSVPDQMQDDRPAVRARSVLEQIDSLPHAQHRSAVRHRDG